jgi:hypothetical protein
MRECANGLEEEEFVGALFNQLMDSAAAGQWGRWHPVSRCGGISSVISRRTCRLSLSPAGCQTLLVSALVARA